MTIASLAPSLRFKSWLANGTPNVFGTLTTYQAGTTTPVATYVDNTGTTQNTNPITLNGRGECNLWLLPNVAYKFVEADQSGNSIGTTDQVVNSQLITYYGVDSGAANAYILTATTPYTTYQNGELIYFVAANTNTGPSTLNVNGLGVIPIVTITGSPIGAGQIQAGIMAQVIYFNGNFQLLSIGSFSGPTVGTFGQEVPLASAATTDLGTAPAHVVLITGTTTITSFGSAANIAAPVYLVRLAQSLTLTYNATSMILPGNTNIISTAGDAFIALYLGNGNWKIDLYQSSTGASGNNKIKPSDTARVSSAVLTADPDLQSNMLGIGRYAWEAFLIFDSIAAGAGFQWTNGGSAVDSRGLAPAVADGFVNAAAYGPKSETPYAITITYATVGTGVNSNLVLYKGSLLVSTPGTFGINWAQAASTASATTLRAGSYLTLALLNTGTSSGLVQRVYTTPGSFTETIPTGYTTLTLEVWGGSAGGGFWFNAGGGNFSSGGGGGSAGYSRSSISVVGLGGSTLNFTVGAAGAGGGDGTTSSASSGTLAITTMTCTGGIHGGSASSLSVAGTGGAAGTAVGGTVVNTPGNAGAAGVNNAGGGGSGAGGFGIPGINGGGAKGGNGGGVTPQPGGVGVVIFSYAP